MATNDAIETTPPQLRQATVLVPAAKMPEFTKRLEALNTKAARFGLDALTVELAHVTPYLQQRQVHAVGEEVTLVPWTANAPLPDHAVGLVDMHSLLLRFPLIKLGDWQVIAQLDATPVAGALVFAVTDVAADRTEAARRRDHPMHCEHCHTARARKQIYLLRNNNSGAYQQVGSTCLQDFTGIDPARALFLAKLADFERYADALGDQAASGAPGAVATLDYLARVLFVCESSSFISVAKAREQGIAATYLRATELSDDLQRNPAAARAFAAARERLRAEAAAMVAWFAGREPKDDFEANVKAVLASDTIKVDARHLAIAAAAVPTYQRHQSAAQQLLRAARSAHVAAEGDKLERPLRVYQVETFDTPYGPQERLSLIDDDGNCFTWRTAAAPAELVSRANRERRFDAGFKVKKHVTSQGTAITEISHLRVKRWLS
ncbi:hypothetical protein P2A78_20770 [Xanthomonas perforans]|uniref:hypothetical protein n=1 Tax=Xanthomonas hortorum TaxID=56454 RepID=UPI001E371D3C|nr:hypothetical protein [Xanthomonas hortorum]MCC8506245.1 hypothetical protein [Xanthomonas hortorum pv. gardneri]